jgi:signal transduction histidine kinase
MHRVLRRQLARLGLDEGRPPTPETWPVLLNLVSATYRVQERNRQRLGDVIDSLDEGLVVLGPDHRVELANPEAGRILGVPPADLAAWSAADLARCAEDPGSHLAALLRGLARGEAIWPPERPLGEDTRLVAADGRSVPVAVSVLRLRAEGAVIVLRDMSARQRLDLELHQAQKQEAVGRLAAGVAHEINTPTQYVADNVRFIERSVASLLNVLQQGQRVVGDVGGVASAADTVPALASAIEACEPEYLVGELTEALAHSREGIERVGAMVRAMNSFSQPASSTPAQADLNRALRDTVMVVRGTFKGVAEVELALADLPPVVCRIHELKQVFLNLVVNAANAIADRARYRPGPGLIAVTSALEGGTAVVTIRDDGTGIPAELAERVFEPFFSTWDAGPGGGQGLALARSVVVERHGGRLSFTSEPGRGTTFRVELPVPGAGHR